MLMWDLLIRGGWVIDGSGGPAFRADVAVEAGRVAALGTWPEVDRRAARILDAQGAYVVPGFIDAHVHGDLMLLDDPVHLPALRQGVTTYIIGQDGSSVAPGTSATIDLMRRYTAGFNGNPNGVATRWSSVAEYLEMFRGTTAVNVAYLIPNGNLRLDVIGNDPRPATDDEIGMMADRLREAMEQGGVGLSTGLEYIPSMYADAREIAALCHVVAEFDGVYVTHMRGYGPKAPKALEEVRQIMIDSEVNGHISHFNGKSDILLPIVDRFRADGLDLTYDTYPYLAGSTILAMVALPPWVQEDGVDRTLERLRDPSVLDRLDREWFAVGTPYPLDKTTLTLVRSETYRWAEGMTVVEAAERAGMSVGRFVCEICVASEMAVGIFGFPGDRTEEDVRAILRHPAHMAGSDGIYCGGFPHPRGWGAFARYLARHTRELGDYDWPEAVTHLAAHASRRYRLFDRGLIRPGMAADIAVVDPDQVQDLSTYEAGRTLAQGVRHTIVNGVPALVDGEPTGATPGQPLRPTI